VGPGGNFNLLARPDKLQAAFIRQTVQSQPSQIDYPLVLITARENYNNIALKQLSSFSQYAFYDPAYPLGYVYPWPVLQTPNWELHITVKEHLPQFTSLSETIVLPPEYFAALKWNLAARLLVSYQLPIVPGIVGLAKDSLNLIRNANAQVPWLNIPGDLGIRGNYNIYSDQVR